MMPQCAVDPILNPLRFPVAVKVAAAKRWRKTPALTATGKRKTSHDRIDGENLASVITQNQAGSRN